MAHADRRAPEGTTDRDHARTSGGERGRHRGDVCGRDLDDRAELLGEQRGERIGVDGRGVQLECEAGGERHLERGNDQSAIRAIVIGGELLVRDQVLQRRERRAEALRIVEVGRYVTELAEHLREARTTEAALPCAEIHEQ